MKKQLFRRSRLGLCTAFAILCLFRSAPAQWDIWNNQPNNVWLTPTNNYRFSQEALQYFARMPVPPAPDTMRIYAELIDSLVLNGVWNKIHILTWTANRDTVSAMLNMKSNTTSGITIGAPSFTPYRGFTCATNKYINTLFNPSTAGSIYTQNSATFAIYSNTDYTTGTTNLGGIYVGTTWVNINVYYDNQMYYALNTNGYSPVANYHTIGLFGASRTAADITNGYIDTDSVGSYSRASTGLSNLNVYVGAWNNQGSAGNFSPREIPYYVLGSGWTSTDWKNFSRCASRCLVKLGTDVLTRIVCDGNSLTGSIPNYVTKLQDTLSATSYQTINKGLGGLTIEQMNSRFYSKIYHLPIHKKNVLIFWEGTNAIQSTGLLHADSVYREHRRYGLMARNSGGWDKIIVMTTLPFGTSTDSVKNLSRDTLNNLLIAHYTEFADTIINLCDDTNIGQWGDQLNTTFYSDKVHLTDAGQAIVMRMVYTALKNLKVIQ